MEEQPSVKTGGVASATTEPSAPHSTPAHIESQSVSHESEVDGYSWAQKGLFFAVIVGVVVAYLRMNRQKSKRYMEKSMA